MSRNAPAVLGRADTALKKAWVLLRIYRAWLRMPEQRLGQLLNNASSRKCSFVEDELLVKLVERFVE